MTKIALNKLTQIQQKELDADPNRKGIVVSAVCPGYCKTDATRGGGFLTADVGKYKCATLNPIAYTMRMRFIFILE